MERRAAVAYDLGMYDATPLQAIAHGFVGVATVNGPITNAFVNGVESIVRNGTGITEIILDEGLPGGGTVALEDARILVCPTPNIAGPIAFDAAGPIGGPNNPSLFKIKMWSIASGQPIDNGFFFIIMRPGASDS